MTDLFTPETLPVLAARIERAQAAQNAACARVASHGVVPLSIAGGQVIFAGAGSPLTQAVALALGQKMTTAEFDQVEALLGREPGPMQIETCPYTDATLLALLAERGYRISEFQQVLVRAIETSEAPPSGVDIRPIRAGEEERWAQVIFEAFTDGAPLDPALVSLMLPATRAEGTTCFMALVDGVPAGGGAVAVHDGIATLAGAGIKVPFRRRGLQTALVRARLAFAAQAGCAMASSSTHPGTTSQRNLERMGFRIAYPKVVLVRSKEG
ncbi:GNAT family N-acetyltransferase [Hyalangium rubrum]|uniref:GNAT family N-acetyltransferase n=1 Tax=Hyalangium rubrum TaxID=3103134 RepID=A0ABU5H8L8_9BACT|nr:GNAT family N-acetyltransferase [Hyalangium sp. s54d21]MDY7229449.1 GNAT family N-acetyltransferase [Hyalangium sp. s54d21]